MKWDEGMSGLFYVYEERKRRGGRGREAGGGDGLTVKCALVVSVSRFSLLSLGF